MERGSLWRILIFIYLTNLTVITVCGSRVKIVNNGYTDLVVAITEAAPIHQSNEIIDNIKKMINEASPILYTATENRVYFKSVKIIIPSSWTHIPSNPSTWEIVDNADVLVDVQNPLFGDVPYTQQLGGCGEPGQKIYMTPNYVATIGQQSNSEEFGNPGKLFVHEWAHYRYGVFDEYGTPGDPKYPLFYRTTPTSTILPNICVDAQFNLKNIVIDISNNSTKCKIDPNTNLYDSNCRYNFQDNFKPTSSLASWHKIDSVLHFCMDDQVRRHNPAIPNKHNDMCNRSSVWAVVLRVLYKELGTNATINLLPFPNVDFQILRVESSARFVVVIDVSRSMNDFNRIGKLSEAVRAWIEHDVKDGSYVGMVKFSSKASIVSNLTEVTDLDSRKNLADKIPRDLIGATCIGCGLKLALEILQNNQNGTAGIIILVTDGKNTEGRTNITDVSADIITAGIRVVTIAMGPDADPGLEEISKLTSGKSYYIRDEDTNSQTILEAFLGAFTYQYSELEFKLLEEQIIGSKNLQFIVDPTVGRNLKFSIYNLDPIHDVTIKLTGPQNQIITDSQTNTNNFFSVTVDKAEAGNWLSEVTFKSSLTRPAKVVVTTRLLPNAETPIKTTCSIPNGANILNAADDPIRILAEIKKGSQPVPGATVKAYIIKPDGWVDIVDLLDNGIKPDVWENDGVYSKYFTNATQAGRYLVKCQVIYSETTLQTTGFIGSASPHFMSNPEKLVNGAVRVGNFSRVTSGESFQVKIPVPLGDAYPPGDVRDLSVSLVNKSPTNISVELHWTAPGDDLDSGTVSFYELKYSDDETALFDSNFDESSSDRKRRSIVMTDEDLIAGSLLPKEAGSQQLATFLLVDVPREKNCFVALRAVDKSHKVSPVSNIGVFFVSEDTNLESQVIVEMDNHTIILNSNSIITGTHSISVMLAGFGGLLIILFFVLLFVTIFRCWFSKSKFYSVVPTKGRSPV